MTSVFGAATYLIFDGARLGAKTLRSNMRSNGCNLAMMNIQNSNLSSYAATTTRTMLSPNAWDYGPPIANVSNADLTA